MPQVYPITLPFRPNATRLLDSSLPTAKLGDDFPPRPPTARLESYPSSRLPAARRAAPMPKFSRTPTHDCRPAKATQAAYLPSSLPAAQQQRPPTSSSFSITTCPTNVKHCSRCCHRRTTSSVYIYLNSLLLLLHEQLRKTGVRVSCCSAFFLCTHKP